MIDLKVGQLWLYGFKSYDGIHRGIDMIIALDGIQVTVFGAGNHASIDVYEDIPFSTFRQWISEGVYTLTQDVQ